MVWRRLLTVDFTPVCEFDQCSVGVGPPQLPSDRSLEPLAVPPQPEGVKLKSFFWKKIMPYALLSQPTISFWETRPEPVDLDYTRIADLFRAKLAAKKKPAGAVATAGAAAFQVLDMKRATSVGVLMSRLGLPAYRLVHAVYQLDKNVRCPVCHH